MLRTYPAPFGDAVLSLRQALIDGREHHLYPMSMPSGVETVRQAMAANSGGGLFEAAKLVEAVTYLRSGTHLQLPAHWREIPWPGHNQI